MMFFKKNTLNQELIDKKSRYLGCLLGGAVGDALGYPVEFLREDWITKKYGKKGIQTLAQAGAPAEISDDTQMTLFAANALLYGASNGEDNLQEMLALSYGEWLATQEEASGFYLEGDSPAMWIYEDPRLHDLRAPGNTCLSSLSRLMQLDTIEPAINESRGCGTVMRAAPYGLAQPYNPEMDYEAAEEKVRQMAVMDAELTHGHPLAQASSEALASIVFRCVQRPEDPAKTLEEVIRASHCSAPELCENLERAVQLALDSEVSDLEGIHKLGAGWIGDEALLIAVFCAVRCQNDFAKALQVAVNHSGDSDSTGAICGNILGAWLGVEAVEAAFDLKNLELEDVVRTMAEDLYRAVELGVPAIGEDIEWDCKYRR